MALTRKLQLHLDDTVTWGDLRRFVEAGITAGFDDDEPLDVTYEQKGPDPDNLVITGVEFIEVPIRHDAT